MPDPNDPTAEATIPAEVPRKDVDAARAATHPTRDPVAEEQTLSPLRKPAEDKSSIQNAMEDALDRSAGDTKAFMTDAVATGACGDGVLSFKTYLISPKMRARLLSEFMYHAPHADQIPRYTALRSMALTFATMIVELTPPSREQSLALTKIGEAVMHANAAIARGEDVPEERGEDITGKTPEAAVTHAGDLKPDPVG